MLSRHHRNNAIQSHNLCQEMHATAKVLNLAKHRRRVCENSNEMWKNAPKETGQYRQNLYYRESIVFSLVNIVKNVKTYDSTLLKDAWLQLMFQNSGKFSYSCPRDNLPLLLMPLFEVKVLLNSVDATEARKGWLNHPNCKLCNGIGIL